MLNFTQKHFLITGGTSGIGLSTAKMILEQGGYVTVTGRNPQRCTAAQRELGEHAKVLQNDASQTDTGERLANALNPDDKLDGLFLNAAVADIAALEEVNEDSFSQIIDTNVRGPFLQLAALSRFLKKGASVVVTSSSSVYEGAAMTSVYAASKGAISAAVRCWARELAPRTIRVNSLSPGPIESNFRDFLPNSIKEDFERSVVDQVALGHIGSSEQAANVALFLLSDSASFVTGSEYAVDGGLIMR
ncbi:SDR family oxidoreductase [Vibrio sp. S4M6]|uniref:SDR family oxidoreductase n=1 Tax=Vibrio sinus TaxID=2946865 RepID=UPI00202A5173|nr:SDR family oxidoreductase [Vibrio sinus]MCL9783874.1 SDR family oxidoreductase [Vibrio sinus]